MSMKKKLVEGQWQVTFSRMVGTQEDTLVKIVNAPTQQDATRIAQGQVPNASQYTKVIAAQVGIEQVQQMKDPQVEDPNGLKRPERLTQQPGQMMEGLKYPYKLMVPEYSVSIGVLKAMQSVVECNVKNGKVYAEVSNARMMKRLVAKVLEQKHPTGQKLIEGIKNSGR